MRLDSATRNAPPAVRRSVPSALRIALLLSITTCSRTHPEPRAANGEPYALVWSDEFTGDGPVAAADWSFENGFVRNGELQWYQPDNAARVNGMLVIEGRREHKPNPRFVAPSATNASEPNASRRAWANREFIDYTSASINTRGKHAWLYGRFEIRARIDVRTGSWPAFWTLGARVGAGDRVNERDARCVVRDAPFTARAAVCAVRDAPGDA